jgi:hypothetical protein
MDGRISSYGEQINQMDTERGHAGLPSWWTDSETFHISAFWDLPGENGKFDWDTLAQSKVRFTTHCPIDREFFERCHALGVRCFPYVVFYPGPTEVHIGTPSTTTTNPCTGNPLITSTTYEGVDFGSHPEFYEFGENNQPRPFGYCRDGTGIYLPEPRPAVCPNLQAYQDKMVAWVDYIMSLGADGVFVDVISRSAHCYATHPHIIPDDPSDPDAAQNKAFALLLKRVREMVKRRPEGLVLGNSGDPLNLLAGAQTLPEFQPYLDSDMFEGYIVTDNGRTSNPYPSIPTLTWDQLGRLAQPYLAGGKQILVISNFTTRDDAFFSYANARLAGFIWHGGTVLGVADDLSRLRLGQPVTGELTDPSGVLFRVFERGLVAVNWDSNNSKTLTVSPPIPGTIFCDIYPPGVDLTLQIIDVSTTGGVLTIPAASGRVYLFASGTDYGLNRLT